MLRWKNKGLEHLDGKKILKHSGAYTTLLVAVLAMSFFGVCDPNQGMKVPAGSAGRVGSEMITGNDFRRAYQKEFQAESQKAGSSGNFDPSATNLSGRVLRQLIDERIMYLEALKAGFRVSDDEVTRDLVEAPVFKDEKGKFSPELLSGYLRNTRHTEASLVEELRRSRSVYRLFNLIMQSQLVGDAAATQNYLLGETKIDLDYLKLASSDLKVSVSDEDVSKLSGSDDGKKKIKEYYDSHQRDFKTEPQVRARHILVGFQGSRNASADAGKRSKDEARKRAEEVLAKVRGGQDFVKTAKEFTDEAAGKSKGGDLGFFSRDMMVKEFSEAAFALKAGQISEVVESPFGFHVIKVEETKAGKDESLEKATNSIARKIIEDEKRPELLKAQAAKLAEAAGKGSDAVEAVRRELGLNWKATGDFALTARFIPELGSDAATVEVIGSLKDVGNVATKLIENGGSRYLVRLKKKTAPDMTKLTAAKKFENRRTASGQFGYALALAMQSHWATQYRDKGRVHESSEYLTIDSRNKVAEASDSGGGAGG
jgi:peptidyl-prolyl cis-trans isomerase D